MWQLEFSTAGETAWSTCLRVYGSGDEGAGVFIHPPQAAVGWGLLSGMPVPQRFQLPPERQNWFLPWEREATQRVQGLSVAVWPLGRCLNYITGWGMVTWDTDGEKVTRKSLGNRLCSHFPGENTARLCEVEGESETVVDQHCYCGFPGKEWGRQGNRVQD